MEYTHLYLEGNSITIAIEEGFNKNRKYSSSSDLRKAQMAVCIPIVVIGAMKEIDNMQDTNLFVPSKRVNEFGSKPVQGHMVLTQPFLGLLHTSYLEAEPSIIMGILVVSKGRQVNKSFSCGYYRKTNLVRLMRLIASSALYNDWFWALNKEKHLIAYIVKDKWTVELESVRKNTRRLRILNSELTEITGNDNLTGFPLVQAFPKYFPTPMDIVQTRVRKM